jgi:hypothetical protein
MSKDKFSRYYSGLVAVKNLPLYLAIDHLLHIFDSVYHAQLYEKNMHMQLCIVKDASGQIKHSKFKNQKWRSNKALIIDYYLY